MSFERETLKLVPAVMVGDPPVEEIVQCFTPRSGGAYIVWPMMSRPGRLRLTVTNRTDQSMISLSLEHLGDGGPADQQTELAGGGVHVFEVDVTEECSYLLRWTIGTTRRNIMLDWSPIPEVSGEATPDTIAPQ